MEEETFEPLFRTSPFLENNGPFYQKKKGERINCWFSSFRKTC
jgi:hypothetical protein